MSKTQSILKSGGAYIYRGVKLGAIRIDKGLRWISRQIIYLYQHTLSPDKGLLSYLFRGRICAHHPHCSEYAVRTLHRYSFIRSRRRIMERVSTCTAHHTHTYDPDHYRVVFCSSAPIGLPFLQALQNDTRYEVVGLITTQGKPQGRGQKIRKNAIEKERAHQNNPYVDNIRTPRSLKKRSKKYAQEALEVRSRLQSMDIDFLVVIAYGYIIPQDILDIPNIGPINIHGSLLPKYRGASPIQSAILHGEKQTGITIMRMVAKLDQGPIISKHAFALKHNDTAYEVIQTMKQTGPRALTQSLEDYAHQRKKEKTQDETKASYCTKIDKKDGKVNFLQDSLGSIFLLYKAYALRPRVYRTPGPAGDKNRPLHKTLTIRRLVCYENIFTQYSEEPLLTYTNQQRTLNPAVQELVVQVAGKKPCQREDFVNGYLHNAT